MEDSLPGDSPGSSPPIMRPGLPTDGRPPWFGCSTG